VTDFHIAPWLSVRDGAEAVAFYRDAFGATELYRLDGDEPGQVAVARLSFGGADFWLQHDPDATGAATVRMIVTADDPDPLFDRAIAAGAVEASPMADGHGWHIGRLVDPFGHHWEIGRQTTG
jgi:PhnB protein